MAPSPSPEAGKRNVLVAVAGHTPAVITETLWALEHQHRVRIDEIRVITTAPGRESIISQLFGSGGAFARYCSDYGVPPGRIAFSPRSIFVLSDPQGGELQDIRDSRDNLCAADQIFSLIQAWTKREDETLFCSVAGGRKTLGIYLATSLMLCARPGDTLSHVLVAPDFEAGVRDFFYPPPEPRTFRRLAANESGENLCAQLSSEEARVDLADIPFPRLREILGGELPLEQGFTEAVAHSQLLLNYLQSLPPLRLHLCDGRVELGEFSWSLTPQLTAVYAFFLEACNEEAGGLSIQELFERRPVIAAFERRVDRLRLGEKETYAWERMRDLDDFREKIGPCISKINRTINRALGKNRLAASCRILGGKRYRVDVEKFEILEAERDLRGGSRGWRPSANS